MIQYKSKVDIVYKNLMDDIIKGVYKEGDRLVISQISKQRQVSDIPVREAIRRLESEGYVKINANQGAVVCGFDKETLLSIFQIKGVLEGYATRMSIDCLTTKAIKKLRAMNQQMQKAFEENNGKKYSRLNIQFHLAIYEDIPNRELYGLICELWKKWGITTTVFELVPASAEVSIREHEEIIRLIEEKKYDEVEQLVRNHKFRAGSNLSDSLVK